MKALNSFCLLLLAIAFFAPAAQAQTPTPTTTQTPTASSTSTAIPTVLLNPAEVLPTMSDQAASLPGFWAEWAGPLLGLASMLLMGSVVAFIRERVRR